MTEEKVPYIIEGGDGPEEVLNIGALRFVRPRHGHMRIETRVGPMRHTQLLTEAEEAQLARFMQQGDESQDSQESEEDEEELEGAPATFLYLEGKGT